MWMTRRTVTIMAGHMYISRNLMASNQPNLRGLSKVVDSGLPPQTVIPAKAGIQDVLNTTNFWIPACAGMTD